MNTATIPGTLVVVSGIGVLLTGGSGIGKSETALGLLDRGHQLVGDDAVELSVRDGRLWGYCPPLLVGWLAVRDLGMLDVRHLFGPGSLADSALVEYEIEIAAGQPANGPAPRRDVHDLLGCMLPRLRLAAGSGRNLPLLVELAVRDGRLRQRGYEADKAFSMRQQHLIGGES